MKVVRRYYGGLEPQEGWKPQPEYTHAHYCPACRQLHEYAVEGPFRNGAQWSFNGDYERPTFTPSMRIVWGMGGDQPNKQCHYFVTDGQIRYCADSTHALAGLTVNLPDVKGPATHEA